MKKIFSSAIISIFIVSIICCAYVKAAKTYINRTWNMQEQSNWCWVACAQNSVKNLFGKAPSQREGVIYIYGKNINKGGTNAQTDKVAEYFSNNKLSYGHTSVGSIKGFDFLRSKTDKGYTTILSSGYYNDNVRINGHDVLMIGYDIRNNTNYIYYFDPFDGKISYCKYKSFKDGTYNNMKYDGAIYNN